MSPLLTADLVVGQQLARHVYFGERVRLTVISCVSLHCTSALDVIFNFYCISMTTIKDAEDAPLSDEERVSDARIIPRQSERTTDTETSQSLSDEAHTVRFPFITLVSRQDSGS